MPEDFDNAYGFSEIWKVSDVRYKLVLDGFVAGKLYVMYDFVD